MLSDNRSPANGDPNRNQDVNLIQAMRMANASFFRDYASLSPRNRVLVLAVMALTTILVSLSVGRQTGMNFFGIMMCVAAVTVLLIGCLGVYQSSQRVKPRE